MRSRFLPAILGLLLCAPAMAQRPTPDQQRTVWEAARQIALNYSAALPDFICTEKVQRVVIVGVHNTTTDQLTIQLGYNNQKEKYNLVAIDGKPTTKTLDSLGGLISGGEFGSLLLRVFEPSSAADFQWKSETTIRQRHATIYTYRVARGKSHYVLGHRDGSGELVGEAAGYRGEVYLDSESRVLKLTAQADDIPKDSGILSGSVQVDYDFTDVAGHSYLLPTRSEAHLERPLRNTSDVVSFVGYRKFEAETTIDFGGRGQ
jgi:hypothetical protein